MCVLCGPTDSAQAVVDHSITHPFALEPKTDYVCSECGEHVSVHPDKMEFLAKHQMDTIIRRGYQLMNIFGGDEPGFTYTVGRTVNDRPELLITGDLEPEVRAGILALAASKEVLEIGEHEGLLEGYPVQIVKVDDPQQAKMFAAVQNFGDDVTALQVVWPDFAGRFPNDPDFEYGPDVQPVYGTLP